MIAVIADDITGGAEIAGTGFRYGLTVELSTRSDIPCPDVDLWVISTAYSRFKKFNLDI
jgi:uncharacterized protein YgbK (DUF1537 family)